jgi:DNA polymerase-3 subunit delta'
MFEKLLGQEFVKRSLSEAVSTGRIGHAYAFCGPDGIGRKSFAREFALPAMCTEMDGRTEPCGRCAACRLSAAGTNPDLSVIAGDPGRATIGVETVRALEEDIATAPTVSARKVYIIDRSEKLTVQAQNALLKTIEEPPEYVMLILICSNPALLIDTVRSRITRLDFARNSPEEVLTAYRAGRGDKGELSRDDERFVVSYADGIIGRALQLNDFGLFGRLREELLDALSALEGRASVFRRRFTELFTAKENADQKEFLFFELTSFLRDLMLSARFGAGAPLQNEQFRDKIEELSALTGCHGWEKMLDKTAEAYKLMGQNVNFRMMIANLAADLIETVKKDDKSPAR